MSNNTNTCENERTYLTGELARTCGVTVRTVQYYDEKGLLPPAELTDGGRRVYVQADAAKLRKILLLKSLGLKLADIRSFLESDVSATMLRDILESQDAKLAKELEDRARARRRIAAMIDALDTTGELPAETVPDMEGIVRRKVSIWESELAPFYKRMLAIGIVINLVEVGTIAWWVVKGDWRPFALALPLIVVAIVFVVRAYRRKTAYLCPHCRKVFVPRGPIGFLRTIRPRLARSPARAAAPRIGVPRYRARDWALRGNNVDSGGAVLAHAPGRVVDGRARPAVHVGRGTHGLDRAFRSRRQGCVVYNTGKGARDYEVPPTRGERYGI